MKVLIILFLTVSLNLSSTEALAEFDQYMATLVHKTNHYLKQLEGSQGCRVWRAGHAILRTELRKWCKARSEAIENLNEVIASKNLTSRNKMAVIDILITDMEKTWQEFEKSHPARALSICREAAPEEKDHFDGFADYYHDHCKNLFTQINQLFEDHSAAFPEVVCTICYERQPEVMYACKHFQFCVSCSKKVQKCPTCRGPLVDKKKPTFYARCKGCHKETVDTICINCNVMELCEECSQKQHTDDKFVHSCSSFFCKFKQRRIEKCFTSEHE